MADLATRTFIENFDWPVSPEFKEFSELLGLRAERQGKGINWPAGKNLSNFDRQKLIKELEILYSWGKERAKKDNVLDAFLELKKFKEENGIRTEGLTLVQELRQAIRFKELSKETQAETESAKEVSQEKEAEGQEKTISPGEKIVISFEKGATQKGETQNG